MSAPPAVKRARGTTNSLTPSDPTLSEILHRLAADTDDRDALEKAADDLRDFVNGHPDGEITLSEEINWELDAFLEPFLEEAKSSVEKRLTLGPDVVHAWGFIGKAGMNLVDLDRPDGFGDGKRAYLILFPYVERSIRHLHSCCNEDDMQVYMYCYDFAYVRHHRAIDYISIREAYKEQTDAHPLPSEDDLQTYYDETADVMWDTILELEKPLAAAVQKVRQEEGRNETLAESAGKAEWDLTKLLMAVVGQGFVRESEMGDDLFEDARREMMEWHDSVTEEVTV